MSRPFPLCGRRALVLAVCLALTACAARPARTSQPTASSPPGASQMLAAQRSFDALGAPAFAARPATAPAPPVQLPAERAAFVALATSHNPTLDALAARAAAAQAAVRATDGLPQPEVTAGVFALPIETRNGPIQGRVGLMQALPQWGRRGALGEAAEAEAEAAELALRAARSGVELSAEELWLDLIALSATQAVLRANLDSFRASAEVVRGRFEANLAGSSELFAIEEEVARLEDELESVAARYPVVWARMAALIGAEQAPADGPRPGLESLQLGRGKASEAQAPDTLEPALGVPDLPADAWRAALEHGTWASAVLAAREAGAAARIEVAEASNEPRFKLGVEYTFVGDDAPGASAGDDALALSFGVSVPLWRDADAAEVERERALLRATRFERVAQRAADQARLEELLAFQDENVRHLALLETRVIPLAQQTIAAEQRAYEAGSGSYLDLVRLQRRLFDDLLEAQLARIELARIALRLENLTRAAAPHAAGSSSAAAHTDATHPKTPSSEAATHTHQAPASPEDLR